MVDHKSATEYAKFLDSITHADHQNANLAVAYLDLRRLVKEYFKQADDDTMNSDCRAAESALRAAIEQGD